MEAAHFNKCLLHKFFYLVLSQGMQQDLVSNTSVEYRSNNLDVKKMCMPNNSKKNKKVKKGKKKHSNIMLLQIK